MKNESRRDESPLESTSVYPAAPRSLIDLTSTQSIENCNYHGMTTTKERRRNERDRSRAQDSNWALGRVAVEFGTSVASSLHNVTVPKARYWKKKVLDPTFRNGELGGTRKQFHPDVEKAVCGALHRLVKNEPTLTIGMLAMRILDETGHMVSKSYIKIVLAAADWTYGAVLS